MRFLALRISCLLVSLCFMPSIVKAELPELRLDPNVRPTFQSIALDLDANQTDYRGTVTIALQVGKATNSFRFHAEEMELDRIVLSGSGDKIKVQTAPGKENIVLATTEARLEAGKYTLEIDFYKPFNTQAVGLYRIEHEGQGYLFTQLQAIDARKAFPCWDEPQYKIPFQVTVNIPADQEVVTNTPLETETKLGPGKRLVFAETKPLPTYLLAIAAGPLGSVPIKNLSVPGRVYTVKGQSHLAEMAIEITSPVLQEIENYFGSPYPYRKLDLIAIPEYWPGAMENPGAITFTPNILLVGAEQDLTMRQKRWLVYVMAHELAHMWFGNLVTMLWWNDLWLNESFATWLGDKISRHLYPHYRLDLNPVSDAEPLLRSDARPSTRAIRRKVVSAEDINEDTILAYGKGSKVLGMVEDWIGSEAFRKGVITYLQQNVWGNATADDLWSNLARASGKDVKSMLSSFVEQSGFPLIRISRNENGLFEISQKRFLNYGVQAPAQNWTLPIRLKYSDGKITEVKTVLLASTKMALDLSPDTRWILPDADAMGYYRWLIPDEMLNQIALKPLDYLTDVESRAFLANTAALLSAGIVNGQNYLSILSGFAKSLEPELIDTVLDNLQTVRTAFVSRDLADSFAAYLRDTLGPALNKFGLSAKPDESPEISELRPLLIYWLGKYGEDASVRKHATSLALDYMRDPASITPPLARYVLRVAAVDGDRQLFEACKKGFENAKSPVERGHYLAAIGSFSDSDLQRAALDYMLAGPLNANELFTIPRFMSATDAGSALCYRWMEENYEEFTSRIPNEFASFLPYFASGCSEERLEAAREFFADPAHNVAGTERHLNKVAEEITDCANLRKREGAAVAAFLNGRSGSN